MESISLSRRLFTTSGLLWLFLLVNFSAAAQQPTWGWVVNEGGPYYYEYAPRMTVTPRGEVVTFGNIAGPMNSQFYDAWHPVLMAMDSTGAVLWRHEFGGDDMQFWVTDLKPIPNNPAGGFYGLAKFVGTMDLGPLGTFLSSSQAIYSGDAMIFRFDALGNLIWARQIRGNPSSQSNFPNVEPFALAVDNGGNVWVSGYYTSQLFIGGNSYFSGFTGPIGFLGKFSPAGSLITSLRLGGSGDSRITGLAVTRTGGVLASGTHYASPTTVANVVIGNFVLPRSNYEFFVASFSAQGQPEWVRARTNLAPDSAAANFIVSTQDGGYVVAGHMKGTTRFGATTFTSANTDIFVTRYDSLGQVKWAQQASSGEKDVLSSFTLDAQDNAYFATTGYQTPFGVGSLPGPPSSGAIENAIFARITAQGQPSWIVRTNGISSEEGNAITTDAARHVYCSAQYYNTLSIGGTTLTSAGGSDFFIARLDGARPLGSPEPALARSLSLYPNPLVVGTPLHLTLGEPSPTAVTATLTDAVGRRVQQASWPAGTRTASLASTGLAPGLYILHLTVGAQHLTRKVVLN